MLLGTERCRTGFDRRGFRPLSALTVSFDFRNLRLGLWGGLDPTWWKKSWERWERKLGVCLGGWNLGEFGDEADSSRGFMDSVGLEAIFALLPHALGGHGTVMQSVEIPPSIIGLGATFVFLFLFFFLLFMGWNSRLSSLGVDSIGQHYCVGTASRLKSEFLLLSFHSISPH